MFDCRLGSQPETNAAAMVPLSFVWNQYDLQAGMPLIHLIPMSEKEVVPHIHILTDSEWNALNENEIPYKFFNWGAHRRKIKK